MLLVAVTIFPFESSLFTQLQALKLQPARPHPHRCPSQSDSWYAAYSKASHAFKKQKQKKNGSNTGTATILLQLEIMYTSSNEI